MLLGFILLRVYSKLKLRDAIKVNRMHALKF